MRLALLTLPSVMSDAAVLDFCQCHAGEIVFLGLSDPQRPNAGGPVGQLRRHLARSGPRILPYLALGFGLPGRRRAFRRFGIPPTVVRDINGPAMQAALRAARPDLIVSFHFDQILSSETIALARLGGINVHPGLLPRHRGPIPAFWALYDGDGATGITVHRLAARIDSGAILAQRAVTLPPGISALEAALRLHRAGLPLLDSVLADLPAGDADPPPPLPYRPFPDAETLRQAARRGIALVRPRDLALPFLQPPPPVDPRPGECDSTPR